MMTSCSQMALLMFVSFCRLHLSFRIFWRFHFPLKRVMTTQFGRWLMIRYFSVLNHVIVHVTEGIKTARILYYYFKKNLAASICTGSLQRNNIKSSHKLLQQGNQQPKDIKEGRQRWWQWRISEYFPIYPNLYLIFKTNSAEQHQNLIVWFCGLDFKMLCKLSYDAI